MSINPYYKTHGLLISCATEGKRLTGPEYLLHTEIAYPQSSILVQTRCRVTLMMTNNVTTRSNHHSFTLCTKRR